MGHDARPIDQFLVGYWIFTFVSCHESASSLSDIF
jgi:hypothetical protein